MTNQPHKRIIIGCALAATALAACGSDDPTSAPASNAPVAEVTTASAVVTTERASTSSAGDHRRRGSHLVREHWSEDVSAACDEFIAGLGSLPEHDGTAEGIAAFIDDFRAMAAGVPRVQDLEAPAGKEAAIAQLDAVTAEADEWLASAAEAAAAGDAAMASDALERAFSGYGLVGGTLAAAGARCGDAEPERAAAAAVNTPVPFGPWQIASGFDAIWVSEMHGGRIVRLDPESGAVTATVDVGEQPFKLQPADGRIWARLESRYVAIDPETGVIVTELTKSDVGPEANRSWAVDGALWICDGRRLHRYDPATVAPVAVVELTIDCGQVYATDELVVAWSYNEDDGESGNSAAAFIDPVTNEVQATIDLPVDVGVPAVLEDDVFFPGWGGSTAVVVDRARVDRHRHP